MKLPFKELPGTTRDYLRPAVPVTIEGLSRAPQLCLLDTGARDRKELYDLGGGADLGLAIVLDIVQAYDGRIRVESEPRRGSRFTSELPR